MKVIGWFALPVSLATSTLTAFVAVPALVAVPVKSPMKPVLDVILPAANISSPAYISLEADIYPDTPLDPSTLNVPVPPLYVKKF